METRRARLVTAAVVLLSALPFAGRAFHMDDAYYLSLAREIPRHPLDPYAGSAGLDGGDYAIFAGEGRADSTFDAMSHPPLVPYVLALAGGLFGQRETALHVALLVFPLGAALAFLELARRLTTAPLPATLLLAGSPVFVLAAHSVMTDVPLLALMLGSLASLAAGLDRGRRGLIVGSGVLAGLAALTRYVGLVTFVLIALYAWARRRPLRQCVPALVAGLLTVGPWVAQNLAFHGTPHVATSTRHYLRYFGAMLIEGADISDRVVSTLAGLGGTMLALAIAVVVVRLRRGVAGHVLAAIATAAVVCFAWVPGTIASRPPGWRAALAVFLGAGLVLLAEAARVGWAGGREGRFLLAWCLGLIVASALLLPSGTVRYALPALPALVLLLVDREGGLPPRTAAAAAAASLALAVALGVADAEYAGGYRAAAAGLGNPRGRIFFTGEWGFRSYMERAGHLYLRPGGERPRDGDLVVNPRIAGLPELPPDLRGRAVLEREIDVHGRLPLRVMSPEAGAGYYSHAWGLLPYGFARGPLERFDVYRVGPEASSR
jgi:Dolichyl-phosphate-mannose-protein mannosyltransferase